MNITILVGIPCSGKSSWAHLHSPLKDMVISRDTIREFTFGKYYKQNWKSENIVTRIFNDEVKYWLSGDFNIIMDNCHCKEKYIDQIIEKYPDHNIKIKFFEYSLFKAYYRNIIRFVEEGKWIPMKVIKTMYKNFNKINRKKYAKYILM